MSDDCLDLKYFVLNPTKDTEYGIASRVAVLSYASQIEHVNPQLAQDLRNWVANIREALMEKRKRRSSTL
jgi:hypothetical protein